MKPEAMITLLNTAKEDDEKLEELGDFIIELVDDGKNVDIGVIEALFRIHERLDDPDQSLFNALEVCAMGPQEKIVRKLARESVKRKLNHCNIQLVGNEPESITLAPCYSLCTFASPPVEVSRYLLMRSWPVSSMV